MNFFFKYACLALILLVPSVEMRSQKPGRSSYERKWAILHPFAAIRVKKTYNRVKFLYNDPAVSKKMDAWSSGGKMDAFRHIFYMACFAQKIKVKKLRKLGQAHEKYNYRQFVRGEKEAGEVPDSLAGEMDVRNNELGFEIGAANKGIRPEQVRDICFEKIAQGKAWILKRNKEGKFVDCQGNATDLEKRTWSLNKCLVPSDQSE